MKWMKCCIGVAVVLAAMHCQASEHNALILPASTLERNGAVSVVFHLRHGYTGHGLLKIHWTDSLGRMVQDDVRPVVLDDEDEITFPIELSRAVAIKNTLQASLSLEEVTAKGADHTQEEASVDFVARPGGDGWKDYAIIMYQQYPSAVQPALKQLGINGGQYVGTNSALPDYLLDNNMQWYSENIATDFYAEYHRDRPNKSKNWSFLQAQNLYTKNTSSMEAFKRHPGFWDPEWRRKIHDRIVDVVKRNLPYNPFFYSLSDESGIADLGSPWDFDFSDQSLVPMRRWLRGSYGTLDALNAEWGTHFTAWDLVTPLTTNEAMRHKDDNFAAWADFKEWMDISYADALRMGVDAAHEVDPKAFVAILGGQMPGWGGYDYGRLTRTVTAMEVYDIGGSAKLAHSLNPDMPLLSTSFASSDWERHRVWYELLQGQRGLILWDDTHRYLLPDGSKGEAGKRAESYYNEIRDGMGALVINSIAHDDGIAIHYSQPSMRTEWMLERRPDGDAWMKQSASYERMHNNFLRLRESWGHAIEDQGLQYNFVSYLQVEEGELLRHGYHVLILPHSSSLSEKEAENIRTFVASGGVLVADGMPGTFDEHSRRLKSSLLADLFPGEPAGPLTITLFGKGKAILVKANTLDYLQDRILGKEGATFKVMTDLFQASGVRPEVVTTDDHDKPVVGVDVQVFSNGAVRLLSLQSNPQQRVNELGPPDFRSNQRFEKPQTVRIHLPLAMYVYDVRQRRNLGQQRMLNVIVDPYEPTILALTSEPQPSLQVSLPAQAVLGTTVPVSLSLAGTLSAIQIYHVDVIDPTGKRLLQYSGNVIASGGAAVKNLPLAKNDAPGQWTIRVQDMLTGDLETRTLNVHP